MNGMYNENAYFNGHTESLEDVHHVRHKSRLRTVVRSQKFRFLRQMLDTVQAASAPCPPRPAPRALPSGVCS